MTIKIRPYKRGGYEVDICITRNDGTRFRERLRSPVSGAVASRRWGEARQAELMRAGTSALEAPPMKKEVPTLESFVPRFIDGYAKANRQKASTIATKQRVLRLHILPRLRGRRLDEISNEDVQHLKAGMSAFNPKTVNNAINVLSKLLNVAVEWGVIHRLPCRIKLLRTMPAIMKFYEDAEYARLVEAARRIGPHVALMVLLAGDAGLRRGEIIALRQCDIDLSRRMLFVRRNVWRTIEDVPKGGRERRVPLTNALFEALSANRHLRGDRVLYQLDGSPVDENVLQHWMERATERAGLERTRSLHVLRHTFCTRLAMRAAPAKAIQELAGHQSLGTTLLYMHLSPAARESAIRLLDAPPNQGEIGDILETGRGRLGK